MIIQGKFLTIFGCGGKEVRRQGVPIEQTLLSRFREECRRLSREEEERKIRGKWRDQTFFSSAFSWHPPLELRTRYVKNSLLRIVVDIVSWHGSKANALCGKGININWRDLWMLFSAVLSLFREEVRTELTRLELCPVCKRFLKRLFCFAIVDEFV